MTAFILCNLLLAILELSKNPYLPWLTGDAALGVGLTVMALSLLLGYLKKLPTQVWHDGFITATLLVWYASWKPLFEADAPMFIFYPLYFSLITAVVTLSLINKSAYFDQESIQHLRYMNKLTRFDFSVNIVFVLVSLLITRHYALYPMAVTFYVMRHTIVICLEKIDGR
ncbi:MAG: hypothetical protein PHW13_07440 [Methylococcales bacterium]|nr:hypothetical protein [Methylococcales bacterium]